MKVLTAILVLCFTTTTQAAVTYKETHRVGLFGGHSHVVRQSGPAARVRVSVPRFRVSVGRVRSGCPNCQR